MGSDDAFLSDNERPVVRVGQRWKIRDYIGVVTEVHKPLATLRLDSGQSCGMTLLANGTVKCTDVWTLIADESANTANLTAQLVAELEQRWLAEKPLNPYVSPSTIEHRWSRDLVEGELYGVMSSTGSAAAVAALYHGAKKLCQTGQRLRGTDGEFEYIVKAINVEKVEWTVYHGGEHFDEQDVETSDLVRYFVDGDIEVARAPSHIEVVLKATDDASKQLVAVAQALGGAFDHHKQVTQKPQPRCGQTWRLRSDLTSPDRYANDRCIPAGTSAMLVDVERMESLNVKERTEVDCFRIRLGNGRTELATTKEISNLFDFISGPTTPETPREAFERVVRLEAEDVPDGLGKDEWLGRLVNACTGHMERSDSNCDSVQMVRDRAAALRAEHAQQWERWRGNAREVAK